MHFKVGHVESRLLEFLLAALEVIRRGHWNFYRYIFYLKNLLDSWRLVHKNC
jgi:hypothetical protein